MNVDEAVIVLLVSYFVGGLISYFVYKREINKTIDAIFGQPLVKGAMSVLGKKSGEVRHEDAVMNRAATAILNSPQAKVLKTVGKQLGFDIDEMIEDQGAAGTMEQILTAAEMMNIDLSGMIGGLVGGLNTPETDVSGANNPYLK